MDKFIEIRLPNDNTIIISKGNKYAAVTLADDVNGRIISNKILTKKDREVIKEIIA